MKEQFEKVRDRIMVTNGWRCSCDANHLTIVNDDCTQSITMDAYSGLVTYISVGMCGTTFTAKEVFANEFGIHFINEDVTSFTLYI